MTHRHVDAGPDINGAAACRAFAVTKVYGRRDTAVRALRDVTLTIPAGAFTAIMGPSGSGKSTLLHCLAALDSPTAGRIFLGNTELTALSRRQQAQVRRDRIGFVFQAFNLVPTLSTLENITLPQRLAGRRPDRDWLDHVVTRVGLGDRLRHRPSELSGGQQQRVALARALAGRPEVIFADEPTGNLDSAASREMLTLLRDAVDRFGQTVVTVTHDHAISDVADHVVLFTDGQVVDRLDRASVNDGRAHRLPRGGDRGSHTSTDATLQPDRPDTMRSRRRRQADETPPGRPMVGSDDEVEVARQERWLQRIREQFEAEQDHLAWADTDRPQEQDHSAWTDTSHQTASADTDPHEHAHSAWTDTSHQTASADTDPHEHDPTSWTQAHGLVDDQGWLPPERARMSTEADAGDVSGSDHGRAESVAGAADGRYEDDRGQVADRRGLPAGSEQQYQPAAWSRPHPYDGDEPATTHPPTAPPWMHDDDPWAPADRHQADKYRDNTGQFRRTRDWAMEHHPTDHGTDQTTGEPLGEPATEPIGDLWQIDEPTGYRDHPRIDEPTVRPRSVGRFDRWSPPEDVDASPRVNGAHRDSAQRNGHAADAPVPPRHTDRPGTVAFPDGRGDPAPRDPADVATHQHDPDPHQHHPDGHQHHPDGHQHHPDGHQHHPDGHQHDPDPHQHDPDPNQHDPDPHQHDPDPNQHDADPHQHDDVDPAHSDPQALAPRRAAQHQPSHGTRQAPRPASGAGPSEVWMPRFDAIWSEYRNGRRPATPAPDSGDNRTGAAASAHSPAGDSIERQQDNALSPRGPAPDARPSRPEPARTAAPRPAVPPALASLRSTRRPDESADPVAALQSLQDQLERLGSGRRRPRRPRGPSAGPSAGPTDGSERR